MKLRGRSTSIPKCPSVHLLELSQFSSSHILRMVGGRPLHIPCTPFRPLSPICTRATLLSCVCLSVHLSQVGVLLKRLNVEPRQKSRQNSNGVTPNGGAKCRWSRLNAGALAAHWRLSTRSVVSLAQSQVCRTERPPFAARSP